MRLFVMLFLTLGIAISAQEAIKPSSIQPWHHPEQPGVVFSDAGGKYGITIKTEKGVFGQWRFRYDLAGIEGEAFRLSIACSDPVAMRNNQAAALAVWYDKDDKDIRSTYLDPDGNGVFSRIVTRPPNAAYLQLEASLRFVWNHKVTFDMPTLTATEFPARPVRVIVTKAVPDWENASISDNMKRVDELFRKIEAAGERPDLVVFPENFLTRAVKDLSREKGAQRVPGPFSDFLGQWAKKLNCYVATSLWRTDGDRFYNSAILIGRDGKLIGIYDKVHLTINEGKSMTPGTTFPVFDLDFGRVGMLICWDLWFPESVRELRLKGAELIIFPIASTGARTYEYQWRARCMDNQVFLAAAISGRDAPARILNHHGVTLAETFEPQSFAAATIDLNQRINIQYLSAIHGTGELGHIYLREARPEAYTRNGTVEPKPEPAK